jgi:GAF domain-containing protein/HAMP domain-containing protein
MIDHFLRRLPVSWRLIITYLLVIVSIGIMMGGLYITYNALIDWIGRLLDLQLQQQMLNLVKERLQVFVSFGLIVLVGGFVMLLLVSRSVTRQINEIREKIENIRAGRVEVNRPVAKLDEFGLLTVSINHLAAQIEKDKEDHAHQDAERLNILKGHALQLAVAAEMAREVAALRDVTTLVDRCAQLIQERFDFYHVGIYLLDDERRYLVLKTATGTAGGFNLQRGVKSRLGEINVISNVVGSGEPRIINNVEIDYIFRKDPLLPDTHAEAIFPLREGREVIGVLDVHSQIVNVFGDNEITILQILADELSIAIQKDRLEHQLNRSNFEANSLYQRYTQEIWSREAMGKSVGGYEYNLLEVNPVAEDLRSGLHLPDEVIERLKSGRAIQVKNSLLVNSKELDKDQLASDRSVLLVPLLLYNQMVGVIGLEEDKQDHDWTDEEISIIEAVTAQIALSLDNARLLEESQIRSGQLRLLQEVTAVAASHTNLYELLDNVSQKLRASFNLLHCGMFLLEPDGKDLDMVANASAEPFMPGAKLVGTRILLGENSIIEKVVKERTSLVIYDVQKKAIDENNAALSSLRDFIQIRDAETIIFVPILSRGEVMGVATLELADASRHFSEADLQLMDQISLQISSAIDVANSFEQATLRADRERRVGEITSRIRESLDIQTILKTAALEVRTVLGVPEVTVRLASSVGENGKNRQGAIGIAGEDASQ